MMFKEKFADLVSEAVKKSNVFYSDHENKGKPNPFYIGFGNPNSEILILGKEKGFEANNTDMLKAESIDNPSEWHHYLNNNKGFYLGKFKKSNTYAYLNSYYPYDNKKKSGHTWNAYSKLTKMAYPSLGSYNNDFLTKTFITEVNYAPSKYSVIKKFSSSERIDFLRHEFFRSFKTTILGCGGYLNRDQIENIFDVKYADDLSAPRKKLVVYLNTGRVLLHTRQLSADLSREYLEKIHQETAAGNTKRDEHQSP